MKDILVKGKRIKTELWILQLCVLFVCAVNIYSIVKYDTAWSELITQLPLILLLSLILYVVSVIIRGMGWLGLFILSKKSKEASS